MILIRPSIVVAALSGICLPFLNLEVAADEPGRFELLHLDPYMVITDAYPNLQGSLEFITAEDLDDDFLTIEYFDMNGVTEDINSCLQGESLGDAATPASGTVTIGAEASSLTFDLANPSIWDNNVAKICARLKTVVEGTDVDEIDFLGTITRTFTGAFTVSVSTKTKETSFKTVEDESIQLVNMDAFTCDASDTETTGEEFAQGEDFKICIKAGENDDGKYHISALTDVVCQYGDPVQSETLVDEYGSPNTLTLVSSLPSKAASVTGVVLADYVADENNALNCAGNANLIRAEYYVRKEGRCPDGDLVEDATECEIAFSYLETNSFLLGGDQINDEPLRLWWKQDHTPGCHYYLPNNGDRLFAKHSGTLKCVPNAPCVCRDQGFTGYTRPPAKYEIRTDGDCGQDHVESSEECLDAFFYLVGHRLIDDGIFHDDGSYIENQEIHPGLNGNEDNGDEFTPGCHYSLKVDDENYKYYADDLTNNKKPCDVDVPCVCRGPGYGSRRELQGTSTRVLETETRRELQGASQTETGDFSLTIRVSEESASSTAWLGGASTIVAVLLVAVATIV